MVKIRNRTERTVLTTIKKLQAKGYLNLNNDKSIDILPKTHLTIKFDEKIKEVMKIE